MSKLRINISKFRDNNVFVALFVLYPIFMDFFNQTVRHFVSNTHKLDTLFCYCLLFAVLCFARNRVIREFNVKWLLAGVAWIALLTTSLLTSKDRPVNIEVISYAVVRCLPAFFVGTLVNNPDKLWKELRTVAFLILLMLIFQTYVIKSEGLLLEYDSKNQYASYQAMIPATILTISLFDSFSWINLVALAANLLVLFTFGERTPFVTVIILFMVLMLMGKTAKAVKTRMIVFGIGIVSLIVILLFSEDIINMIIGFMDKVNMSSRMVSFLRQERSAVVDSGRMLLYKESFRILKENWMLGLGFINERYPLHHAIGWTLSNVHGMYPHNFFLEMLMQMGIFSGCFVIIWICRVTLKTYNLCKKSKSAFCVFLFFFFNGFFPLIASGTYINWIYFYYFMGFCAAIISKRKRIWGR